MDYQEVLRRLAIGDTSFLPGGQSHQSVDHTASEFDRKSRAFARLGATIALGASSACYQDHVDDALAAGATPEEIVGVLISVVPTVGLAKVVSAAPALGLAVGYDADAALECLDPDLECYE